MAVFGYWVFHIDITDPPNVKYDVQPVFNPFGVTGTVKYGNFWPKKVIFGGVLGPANYAIFWGQKGPKLIPQM